jgi:N-acetylglucosamine-6-phosphate deacetylase
MGDLLIDNARLIRPGEPISDTPTRLLIRNGVIVADSLSAADAKSIDASGRRVSPGLIDLHTHGIGTHLYETSAEQLHAGAALLPRFGTTTFLPTLYRVMSRSNLNHLATLTDAAKAIDVVRVPGFHLEGPFLALAGAGADTIDGDLSLLTDLLDACGGFVRAMSISPEVKGIVPVIERLVERGICVFVTHTQASVEQTQRAIDAGARHATHFYDVFPIPPEREPGVRQVGAVEMFLADPRCTVDFICDGIHAPPVVIRAALAAKGPAGVACITDSNIGAGLPAARYAHPWGYGIRVSPDDAARIDDPAHPDHDGLAGSALTMNAGVRNLQRWTSPENAWQMATRTPARIAGMGPLAGTLSAGAPGDVVIWNDDLTPAMTIVGGRIVYRADDFSCVSSGSC